MNASPAERAEWNPGVDKGQCQVLQRPAHVEAAIAVSERLAIVSRLFFHVGVFPIHALSEWCLACVTLRVLPCMCYLACAALHVLPCMCYLACVTLHVLPCMCYLACVTLRVLPCMYVLPYIEREWVSELSG